MFQIGCVSVLFHFSLQSNSFDPSFLKASLRSQILFSRKLLSISFLFKKRMLMLIKQKLKTSSGVKNMIRPPVGNFAEEYSLGPQHAKVILPIQIILPSYLKKDLFRQRKAKCRPLLPLSQQATHISSWETQLSPKSLSFIFFAQVLHCKLQSIIILESVFHFVS